MIIWALQQLTKQLSKKDISTAVVVSDISS